MKVHGYTIKSFKEEVANEENLYCLTSWYTKNDNNKIKYFLFFLVLFTLDSNNN